MTDKKKHDKIICSAFENSLIAKKFFEMHFPSFIKALFSLETLKIEMVKESIMLHEIFRQYLNIVNL